MLIAISISHRAQSAPWRVKTDNIMRDLPPGRLDLCKRRRGNVWGGEAQRERVSSANNQWNLYLSYEEISKQYTEINCNCWVRNLHITKESAFHGILCLGLPILCEKVKYSAWCWNGCLSEVPRVIFSTFRYHNRYLYFLFPATCTHFLQEYLLNNWHQLCCWWYVELNLPPILPPFHSFTYRHHTVT